MPKHPEDQLSEGIDDRLEASELAVGKAQQYPVAVVNLCYDEGANQLYSNCCQDVPTDLFDHSELKETCMGHIINVASERSVSWKSTPRKRTSIGGWMSASSRCSLVQAIRGRFPPRSTKLNELGLLGVQGQPVDSGPARNLTYAVLETLQDTVRLRRQARGIHLPIVSVCVPG